jgi:phytanoyl-CoA hydroxylase
MAEAYPHANLNDKYVQDYLRNGYVIIRNALSPEAVRQAQDHIVWLQAQNPDVDPELLEHWFMRDDPFWIKLIGDPKLLDTLEQFLGPNIASFASHYVCKPPKVGKRIHWHQDGAYWPLQPMEVVSVWFAVDKSIRENGCMRVVPGSHKQGLQAKGMNSEEFERHVKQIHMGKESSMFYVDESNIVDVELNPGDISIHHPAMIHGSEPNTSDLRRCGLTIRYIPTSTTVVLDEDQDPNKLTKGTPFLLRGKPTEGVNNKYFPTPEYVEGKHFKFDPWY